MGVKVETLEASMDSVVSELKLGLVGEREFQKSEKPNYHFLSR